MGYNFKLGNTLRRSLMHSTIYGGEAISTSRYQFMDSICGSPCQAGIRESLDLLVHLENKIVLTFMLVICGMYVILG